MLRRVSEKLVRLHVFDLCCLGILYNLLIYIWSKNLFPFRSFYNRKLGKQTQKLIKIRHLDGMFAMFVLICWLIYNILYILIHLWTRTWFGIWSSKMIACSDHATCFQFQVLGLGTGHSQRLLFLNFLDQWQNSKHLDALLGCWVLHPLAWISWVPQVAWRKPVKGQGSPVDWLTSTGVCTWCERAFDDVWCDYVWLYHVVSDSLPKKDQR